MIVVGLSCYAPKVDPGATARSYGSRAAQLFTEGNCIGAIKEYQKAYIHAARADMPLQQAQYLFNIGRVWYELDNTDSADIAFRAAYREFMYYQDSASASSSAGFISLTFCKRGKYDSAMSWYKRGRPKDLKSNEEITFWLTIQALISLLQNRISEASAWLDRAYEAYKKEKSWNGIAQVDYYRARIAYAQSKYEEARELLTVSLASLDKTPERFRRWRVLAASAMVSFCLGDAEAGERFYRRSLDCIPRGVSLPHRDSVTICPKLLF
jgi:tetratricopeptide (TPR) repeat protein